MMPTEEEKTKVLEAHTSNSDIPLGSAEQFLLTLCSISELSARLNLWMFKLDYESVESVCLWIVYVVLGMDGYQIIAGVDTHNDIWSTVSGWIQIIAGLDFYCSWKWNNTSDERLLYWFSLL